MDATNHSNKCSPGDKGKSPIISMEEKTTNANDIFHVQESVDPDVNVNTIDARLPTPSKRRGRPPIYRYLDGKVESIVNVPQLSNKRLLPTTVYKSPSLSSCTPYDKTKYPALKRLSSNLSFRESSDGLASIEEGIKSWPKKLKQVESVDHYQPQNKCFLPGSFQTRNINILRDNTTYEQKLKTLQNLFSRRVPTSQVPIQGLSNSSLMTNGTTSWKGHVVNKENQSGYNFNQGIGNQSNSGSNGMVNPNNLYGYGSNSNGIVNQNRLFASVTATATARSNQVIHFGSEFGIVNRNKLFGSNFSHGIGNQGSLFSSSGSGFGSGSGSGSSGSGSIVNQNNLFGSTNAISNQATHLGSRTNAMCTISKLPFSHGRHYLDVWSIYRDSTKIGEKSTDNPKESSSVVENGGKEDKRNTCKGKEPMTVETEEIASSEGYNCQLVVPEERPNEYNKQGSSLTTPISPLNESERYEMEDADLPYLDEYGNSSFFPENNMKMPW